MLRVWNFAKIDLLKVRHFTWVIIFPLLSVVLMVMDPSSSVLFAVIYSVFGGIIISSFPYNMESLEERGFLQMLPSRPGEQILGHFLFSALTVIVFFLLGIAAALISSLLIPSIRLTEFNGMDLIPMYPAILGAALLMAGLQDLMLTFFRFENVHFMQLFRIIPAFAFFFLANLVNEREALPSMQSASRVPGWTILLICIAVYIVSALVSARVSVKRGDG